MGESCSATAEGGRTVQSRRFATQGVSAVKRALRDGGYAKAKIGHGGTLDQLASGVLPIVLMWSIPLVRVS